MISRIVIASATMLMMSGCASQVTEAGYYWGNYSNTLYVYTKEPSDESLASHVEELNAIIAESKERELKVPPGIYAELGYIHAASGDDVVAAAHYDAEMKLYPESRIFLERLTADQK